MIAIMTFCAKPLLEMMENWVSGIYHDVAYGYLVTRAKVLYGGWW